MSKSSIELTKPTEKNIVQLKVLNSAILPVQYGPKFYEHVLNDPDFSSAIALFNDVLVGGITCRRMQNKNENKTYLYIMTICVLSAYRKLGMGTRLLTQMEEAAKKDPQISYIELHVQEGNDEALNFYEKHGYKKVELVENYYQKVKPSSAHKLRKEISH